jgi:hypothetical protein
MTDKDKQMTTIGDSSFLAELAEGDKSLENLERDRVLPRLVQIQSTSKEEFKELYGEGTLVLMPGGMDVCQRQERLPVIPIFYWKSWETFADNRDKNSPKSLAKSQDPRGTIARKAANPETRFEQYEGGPPKEPFKMAHVEQLNFVVQVDRENAITGETLSVRWQKGDWYGGQDFLNGILQKKADGKKIPMWAQRWVLQPKWIERGQNKFWGVGATPNVPLLLDRETAVKARAAYLAIEAAHNRGALSVVDGDEPPPPEAEPESFDFKV